MPITSQQTAFLAKPTRDDRISARTLSYVSEMAREDVFDLVARSCVEAGVTRAQLAKRLNKDPGQVSRLLAAPGNWTIDTISEFLFAIDGSMLRAGKYSPLEEAISNNRHMKSVDIPTQIKATTPNPVIQKTWNVEPWTASGAKVTGAQRW